ncbi:hypothetical protein C8R45DRAFT_1183279 [Mycena sanguinolenta]|nr:hypothetical protein C8R45DRAFT_1183279 [Mycena sanguinolenta]
MRTVKMPLTEVVQPREEEYEGVFFDEWTGMCYGVRSLSASRGRGRARGERERERRAPAAGGGRLMVPVRRRIRGAVYVTSASVSTPPVFPSHASPRLVILPTGIPLQQHPACFTEPARPPSRSIPPTPPLPAHPRRTDVQSHLRHARMVLLCSLRMVVERYCDDADRERGYDKVKLARTVIMVGIQLGESVSLGGMGWGRREERVAWLVHLREREARRQRQPEAGQEGEEEYVGEEGEGKAGNPWRGASVLSSISSTPPFSLEARMWVARLCVGGCVSWAGCRAEYDRRIESPAPGALQYLAAFFRAARLHRVIVLTLRGPSWSSTSGGAASLVRRHLYPRRNAGPAPCASDRRGPLGARVPASHIPLPPLSMVPRQAVATANGHEETVVDGKKTIVIRHRREMLVEAVRELREEEGVWLEGIRWRNAREAEAGVAPCPPGRPRERAGWRTAKAWSRRHEGRGRGSDGATASGAGREMCGRCSNGAGGWRMGISLLSTAPRERAPPGAHRRHSALSDSTVVDELVRLGLGHLAQLPLRHVFNPVRGTRGACRVLVAAGILDDDAEHSQLSTGADVLVACPIALPTLSRPCTAGVTPSLSHWYSSFRPPNTILEPVLENALDLENALACPQFLSDCLHFYERSNVHWGSLNMRLTQIPGVKIVPSKTDANWLAGSGFFWDPAVDKEIEILSQKMARESWIQLFQRFSPEDCLKKANVWNWTTFQRKTGRAREKVILGQFSSIL